ncbi:hypothetical protein [Riemerella columbina]|uniref:hypothetical protein n=1 Tax=Riemerella columbina TaxID=103810 RepID=UPI00266FADA5|nr:hypothetical protein [Riemerella columbina]WKS95191.1 hypothetical protein NYR17_00175 [Riemerella columbina]
MKKENIIKKIIEEQQKVISNFQNSVERFRNASDLDEEATHDREDFSHQTEAKDMQLRFEQLVKSAEANLLFLEKAIDEPRTGIESGALIETDKNYIFIGISVSPFKIQDKEVICISEEAPIFAKIKDAKIGDTIDFGSHQIQIISIS